MHTARAFSKNVWYSHVCALQIFIYFITSVFSKVIVLNCIVVSATSTFFRVLDKFAGTSVIQIKGVEINYVLARPIILDTSSHTIASPGIS